MGRGHGQTLAPIPGHREEAQRVDYRVGSRYLIRNVVTGEGTYFDAEEVLSHGHNTIMYGRLVPWEIYIYKGRSEMRGRPTVIPIPGMDYGQRSLNALIMCLKATDADLSGPGLIQSYGKVRIAPVPPWIDVSDAPYKRPHPEYPEEPVYATGREIGAMWGGTPFKESNCQMCRGWGGPTCQGHTPNRDGLVRSAIKALDLFDDVLRLGHVPQSFLHEQRAWLMRRELEIRGMAN